MKSTVIECDECEAAPLRLVLAVARRQDSIALSAAGGLELGAVSLQIGSKPETIRTDDVDAMNQMAEFLEEVHKLAL